MPLNWHSDGHDDAPEDQNADSVLPRSFWHVGLYGNSGWRVALDEQNEDLDEVVGGLDLGFFPSEEAAKHAAATTEAWLRKILDELRN